MEDQILQLLGQSDYAPSNVPELLRQLGLPLDRQQALQRELRKLEREGRITRTKGNRYIQSREADLIPGRIRINRQGKGFLQPDDPELKEIMIPESATSTALHEDRVLVRRDVRARRQTPEAPVQETGAVIRILERHRTQLVGTLQRGRQFLYVIPDDPRMPHDIYVPPPRDVGRPANVGDKVVVELHEWQSRHTNPEGEIVEVLGAPDEEGVDMLSVLRQYDLPLHFPKPVLQEARSFGTTVAAQEIAGREDCRRDSVVTIDPDDAKDFDDAICLQRIAADRWKLWVHIADVSHYVKPGSPLDVEARERGNSTYLVDRVIPMLPEALSNELCSLKPNVDRLTKCVEFLVADDGRVLSTKLYPAVIHSKRRFTYKEVFAILQQPSKNPAHGSTSLASPKGGEGRGEEAELPSDQIPSPQPSPRSGGARESNPALGSPVPASIVQMLHDAHQLAQKIRRLRFKAGSLALDFPEMKIRLDEQGRVARIERVENDVSHQLIEEYMLLANEAVAGQLMKQNIPAIYRVHEAPDERRLNEYREEVLSHHIQVGNLTKRGEVQKLLQKLDSMSIGAALKIGFLRSLMRARYAMEPLGHYGLAKKAYAHFTSPIRRYADLVVHRALFQSSHGSAHSLKQTSEHISDTERNSADAERDSKDVKLYAFLKGQLKMPNPPRYEGLVIDVRNFGFFVDVPGLSMSGLVHLSSLTDDFYIFDPQRNNLVGRRNRRLIQLGDKVQVQVAKVDSFKKQVDFRLAREERKANDDRGDRSRPSQRSQQRFDERRPHHSARGSSRPPQQKFGKFKSQSQSRPPLPSRDAKSQPARPQSGGGNFQAGSARPQIPSSHSRSKFGGRRRR